MPTYVNRPIPLQYTRQFGEAPYLDMAFETTADRMAYLTSPRRYGGMIVADKELERIYLLNTAETAWLPGGGSNLAVGLGFKTVYVEFDGTTGFGEVGALNLVDPAIIDIPTGAWIAEAYIDILTPLETVDPDTYITVGHADEPVSVLDDTTGLVSQLNIDIVTQILSCIRTKATTTRTLTAEITGSDITAGRLRIMVLISDQ